MNRNIKRYPAVWKIRHRSGNIRDHLQRYHINVGKKYGNFRQMSPHYRERRFNNPPVRSNWSYFAEKWNMGVADLDDFARYMGYRDFDEMESRVSPWELYNKSKVKFKYALRKASDKGYQYFKEQPREVVEHEIEETASVSGWLDKRSSRYFIRKYGHYGNYVIHRNGVVLKEKKGFYTCAKEFPNKKDAKDFIKKIKDGKYIVDDHGVIQKVIKK